MKTKKQTAAQKALDSIFGATKVPRINWTPLIARTEKHLKRAKNPDRWHIIDSLNNLAAMQKKKHGTVEGAQLSCAIWMMIDLAGVECPEKTSY